MTALLQLAILLAVVAVATPWLVAAESPLPTPRHSGDITLGGPHPRPVFNGSVVPGGVYSLDELRRVVDRDPVVAAHYRRASLDEMQAVTLTSGRAAYVSYRRGDRIYWTRERVWLKAGETVLTDGTTVIRARCGNCVSDAPQDDVAAVDPAHGELDDFVVPPTAVPGVDALAPASEASLGDLLQVPFAPGVFASLMVPPPFDEPPGGWSFPLVPPIIVPGGGTPGGVTGTPGGTVPPGVLPPGPPGDDPPPPLPPTVFVPPGGGPGTPGSGTGSPADDTTGGPGGSTTGTPTDTLTTGGPVDSTSSPTTGWLTDGTVFPTTTDTSTSSGAEAVPEAGMLWLMAAGAIGLARRQLRRPPTKDPEPGTRDF